MTYKKLKSYLTAGNGERAEIERYIYGIADPQTRDMFYLHFIAGYSYGKTAKHIGGGMTRQCVYVRIKRHIQNK